MGNITIALKHLLAANVSHEEILRAVQELEDAALTGPAQTARQLRNQRYYEAKRLKASENRLTASEQDAVLKASESVLGRLEQDAIKTPLAHVRDITSNSEITGTLSLALVREWSGNSLADMAKAPGIAVLHSLKATMRGSNPCSLEDLEAGIVTASAWYRRRHGPGSMANWDLAVKMAGEARDRRLAGPPEAAAVVPMRSTGPPRTYTEQATTAWDEATKRILADG